MSQRTYSKMRCYFCERVTSANGAARSAHMKAHVRRGEASCWATDGGQVVYLGPDDRPAQTEWRHRVDASGRWITTR